MKRWASLLTLVAMLAPASLPINAEPNPWISGTVVAIDKIPARILDHSAQTAYTIHTAEKDYVVEHGALTLPTDAPKDWMTLGEHVDIRIEGRHHATIRTANREKRLKLRRTSRQLR